MMTELFLCLMQNDGGPVAAETPEPDVKGGAREY